MTGPHARTLLLALALVTACGGGGGGGGSGGGITVSPTSLTFTGDAGGDLPAGQRVRMTVNDPRGVLYGAAWMGAEPSWASVSAQVAGSIVDFQVAITTTNLAAGTRTATLRVGIADASQNILAYQDVPITYVVRPVLRATPRALDFAAIEGGPTPAAQTVTISGDGIAWSAAADAAFIRLDRASGTGPGALRVSVDPAGLAPGAYRGTVTVAAAAGSQVVDVQLAIAAAALTADRESLSFSGVNGQAFSAQPLAIAMNNGAAVYWTARADDAWVVLGSGAGAAPGTLSVGVDPSRGALASGDHSSRVTLTASYGGRTLTREIAVGLALTRPTLTISPASIVAGGANGRTLDPAALQVSLDTGTMTYPFTATTAASWITLAPAAARAGATSTTVGVTWNRSGLDGGTYTGSVAIAATVNGDALQVSVPVTLNLDEHLILADDDGVSFASMPGLATTTRTLHLRDNFGGATAWTASADQTWLSVTRSGATPGDLVLTADPSGLAADTMQYATVTVRSSDTTVHRAETIRVGLWVGSSAPPATSTVSTTSTRIAVDPVRPYAYVHAGARTLTVYNVHTGAVVTSADVGSSALGEMAVASDGSRLYVVDGAKVLAVSLPDLAVAGAFTRGGSSAVYLASARIGGKRFLLTGDGHAFDAASGADLGAKFGGGYYGNDHLATSLDGARLATLDDGISPANFEVYSADYSAVGGGRLTIASLGSLWNPGSNGQDLALNADGSRLYTACGASASPGYAFGNFDVSSSGVTMLAWLPGSPYPNNAEVARDGRVVLGANVVYDPTDVWVYAPDTGQLLWSTRLRAILQGQLKISSDGLRVVGLTAASAMVFATIGR